jgi:uncharacterized protein
MIWHVLAILLVLIGIAGTVLPALPGLPLVFAGLLLSAWADQFARVSVGTTLILGAICAVAMVVDFLAGVFGPKLTGASPWAVGGAALGALVGIFFGPIGLLLGPFFGAVGAELIYRENIAQATKAGLGAWLGLALGAAAKIAALVSMLGIFALAYFTR